MPDPPTVNKNVTLTATVTGDGPTGTVTFGLGGAFTSPITLQGGVATYSVVIPSLYCGANTVTASYSGDANNTSSSGSATANIITTLNNHRVGQSSKCEAGQQLHIDSHGPVRVRSYRQRHLYCRRSYAGFRASHRHHCNVCGYCQHLHCDWCLHGTSHLFGRRHPPGIQRHNISHGHGKMIPPRKLVRRPEFGAQETSVILSVAPWGPIATQSADGP
jgi:hypothetical protein